MVLSSICGHTKQFLTPGQYLPFRWYCFTAMASTPPPGPVPRRKKHRDIGIAFWDLTHDTAQTRRKPHLHKILKRRHRAGSRILSRCRCLTRTGALAKGVRVDSRYYHYNKGRSWYPALSSPDQNMPNYLENLCSHLRERFVIYGSIGVGSMLP